MYYNDGVKFEICRKIQRLILLLFISIRETRGITHPLPAWHPFLGNISTGKGGAALPAGERNRLGSLIGQICSSTEGAETKRGSSFHYSRSNLSDFGLPIKLSLSFHIGARRCASLFLDHGMFFAFLFC